MPVLALSVTEPGEQNVVAPAAVMFAAGNPLATVTTILFDVLVPQVLVTRQSNAPDAVAEYEEVFAPEIFPAFTRHW